MSLIQDALKRQQEDDSRQTDVPAEPIQPVAPPPVIESKPLQAATTEPPATPVAAPPPPPPVDTDEKPEEADGTQQDTARRPLGAWPTLLAVLIILLLVIGGFVWFAMYAFQRWQSGNKDALDEAQAAAIEAVTQAVVQDGATGTAVEETETPPDLLPGEQAGTPPADTTSDQAGQPPTSIDKVPAGTAAYDVASIAWPALTLTGVVGRGANGSAMINGEIVEIGESIEGVKLLSIDKQGVNLQYHGEERFLKSGMSLQ